jgi:hypothetical protein
MELSQMRKAQCRAYSGASLAQSGEEKRVENPVAAVSGRVHVQTAGAGVKS